MTLAEFRKLLTERNAVQSLGEIGKELGVSHAAVGRWIAGKRKPSETVILLAERLWSKRLSV